jgi:hypothetical protein
MLDEVTGAAFTRILFLPQAEKVIRHIRNGISLTIEARGKTPHKAANLPHGKKRTSRV